ncbi:MAG: hypothetical protein IKR61_02655 [Lachnospiraceae bacterium]|nr:hypothetical protein [Lachnospiraceae bacterium]
MSDRLFKAEKWFCRLAELLFAVFVLGILYVIIDNQYDHIFPYNNYCIVPNRYLFYGAAGVLCVLFVLAQGMHLIAAAKSKAPSLPRAHKEKQTDFRKLMRVLGILTPVLFAAQVFVSYEIYFESGWDVFKIMKMVYAMVFEGAKIGNADYFSMCTNNFFLTGIFAGILKAVNALGFEATYFPLIVFGCMLVAPTGWLLADCVRMLTGRKDLVIGSWILFVLLSGLSPWISIPYSDTYTIFFPTFAIWAFLRIKESNHVRMWFLIVFLSLIGYFIKPTVILALIVMVFFAGLHFLFHLKDGNRTERLRYMGGNVLAVLVAVVLALLLRAGMKQVTGFTPDPERYLPPAHYFMMGWGYDYAGGYNQEDNNFSMDFPTTEARVKGDIEEGIRRIKSYYPYNKLVHFISRKMLNNFSDGTFAWGFEGGFYYIFRENNTAPAKFLRSIFYHDGKYFDRFVAFAQALWILTLCMCACNLFGGIRKRTGRDTIVMISVLAIFCFVMVFEARARYLYLYTPLIYMAAATGVARLTSPVFGEAEEK